MARITVEEVKDFGVLPEDTIIRVECERVTVRHVNGKNGGDGWDKLEFKFIVKELPTFLVSQGLFSQQEFDDLLGGPIWGSVGMKLTEHPDNKLRQWAEALLNMGDLNVGFELDTDMLEGRQARASVGHYLRKDGTKAHQVVALLPLAPIGSAQAANPSSGNLDAARAALVGSSQSQGATVGASAPAPQPQYPDDPPF